MISFHGSLNKVGVLKVQVHSKPDNETSHPKKDALREGAAFSPFGVQGHRRDLEGCFVFLLRGGGEVGGSQISTWRFGF